MNSLSIGGVRFVIEMADGGQLVESKPEYLPFLDQPGQQPERPDSGLVVPVCIVVGPMPDSDDLPLLFDTEQAWAAYRDGEDTIFCHQRLGKPGQQLWLARLSVEPPRVTIHCSSHLVTRRNGAIEVTNPLTYPLDQLLVASILGPQGVVIHGAGILIGDIGVAFAGRSGAGKTTLMRLLASAEPEIISARALSDDRVVVRRQGAAMMLHGTPWTGEGRVASAAWAPLKALIFLHHATTNCLRPMARAETLHQLLPTVSIPWYDPERTQEGLDFCDRLVANTAAYGLSFRPDPTVWTQLSRELLAVTG